MTSARRLAANRANARKSTGPRTAAGKARAADNSRMHGLTALLDRHAVRDWYRLILDDGQAEPNPFEQDPVLRAARDLAEAEAQLARVRRAEEEHFRGPESEPGEAEEMLDEERQLIRQALESAASERLYADASTNRRFKRLFQTPRKYAAWNGTGERLLLRLQMAKDRATTTRLKSRERLARTLARYRASAEARRHKALRRWIAEITKRTQPEPQAAA